VVSDGLLLLLDGTLLWGRLWADWGRFLTSVRCDDLLDGHSLSEAFQRVSSFQLLELNGRVLIQELIDGEVASTDLDLDLVSLHLDHDASRSEFVDTFRLSEEHDLQLLAVGVVIDVLRQFLVGLVALLWDVDGNSGLEIDDVALEDFDLVFCVLQVFEKVK